MCTTAPSARHALVAKLTLGLSVQTVEEIAEIVRQAQNPPAGPAGWDQDEYIGAHPLALHRRAPPTCRMLPRVHMVSWQNAQWAVLPTCRRTDGCGRGSIRIFVVRRVGHGHFRVMAAVGVHSTMLCAGYLITVLADIVPARSPTVSLPSNVSVPAGTAGITAPQTVAGGKHCAAAFLALSDGKHSRASCYAASQPDWPVTPYLTEALLSAPS